MEDTKRTTIIARTLAVLIAVLGMYFICAMVTAIFKHFLPPSDAFDIFFLFVFPLPMLVFGCYCIYSGCCLWFKISSENVRRLSFITSIILLFLLIPIVKFSLKSDEIGNFLVPLLMIPAGIFFLFCNSVLLRLFNLPTATDWVQREKSVKRFFGWFAFLLLSIISFLLSRLLPEILNTIETLLCMACSAVVAYYVYKVGVAIALRNKPKEPEISSSPATGS